jgi:Domain of unknown function (DUF4349)
MASIAEPVNAIRKSWHWIAIGSVVILIWVAIAVPNLYRARPVLKTEMAARDDFFSVSPNQTSALPSGELSSKLGVAMTSPQAETDTGRKLVRSISMSLVVQHPTDIANRITALAENLGGYLVSSEGGGQNATFATLTIRVPVARFEEARTSIRGLSMRVEAEKVEAQDVTRQYVDQDATLRNLRAEEAQYLSILKQASTVKDLLAVSEKLSEVRGQIEQQQAEFNALTRQVETASIVIELRTESKSQVAGLNWRPLYQLKIALRDGLESVASYAIAMITILFYLPAVLLWTGTILAAFLLVAKMVPWLKRRCSAWKPPQPRPAE